MQQLLAIAPMMDYTDKHYRYLMRLITHHSWLYTEMLHSHAVIKGDRMRLLAYHPSEHPLALQLGGSDPKSLAMAATIAADYGYDEINLNVGCPSQAVQAGRFGACLMAEPELVGDCVTAMRQVINLPVTVKTRIGIDKNDDYKFLVNFIEVIKQAGVKTFIIHARKAWLTGLSPKENRTIPPLQYERVYQLKRDFPELIIILNGGVSSLKEIEQHLKHVDGVMVGREAYHNPFAFSAVDKTLFNDDSIVATRFEVFTQYLAYCQQQHKLGVGWRHLLKHTFALLQGLPGCKTWRRLLTQMLQTNNVECNQLMELFRQSQVLYDQFSFEIH